VSYFDSLEQQQHGGKYVEAITAYLTKEAASKGVQDQSTKFEAYAETPQSATRQSNSNDCGVLMLHYMQELSMAAGSVRYA
jgi:Ulp1 family protease